MRIPQADFLPPLPKNKKIGIGIVGCGGISRNMHIPAYQAQGFNIVAVADILEENARKASEAAGGVACFTDHRKLLQLDEVQVIDAATHPGPRVQIIRDALNAGKHVLSQKPFVLDLNMGRRLIALARKKNRILAVNQNGRWSPPWKAAYEWVREGVIGDVMAIHLHCHWDHNWVQGTSFDKIRHCILYDFAIHYFDILTCWMGEKQAQTVYAMDDYAPHQRARQKMLAQAMVRYDKAQASLVFDGSCKLSRAGEFWIEGTKGTIQGNESGLLELHTAEGVYRPRLKGSWFPDGFKGTMGALLCAIEEKREPWHSAANNLQSLQLCFAACASSDRRKPIQVRSVRKLTAGNITV